MKVFILASVTADGLIGFNDSHLADWTSKEDKRLFIKLTKESGIIIMGSKTFDTIGFGLPKRKTIILTKNPAKYDTAEGDVLATNESPIKILESLKAEGYESVAICGGAQIYSLFLKENLVDELYLTVEPVIFGSGVNLASGAPKTELKLLDHSALNPNVILLHYKVLKS